MKIYTTKGIFICYGTVLFRGNNAIFFEYAAKGPLTRHEIPVGDIYSIEA